MSDTITPAVTTWRAREDRALRALLVQIGVTPEQFEAGGPDGEELAEMIFADVEVWNDFGLITQDWAAADDDVHTRLLAGFAVGPNEEGDEPDFGWTLYPLLP